MKRAIQIAIRISQQERTLLTQLAKKAAGGNQSAVIRALIRTATPETVRQALAETKRGDKR